MSDGCVVLTTTANREEARALARGLVQNRLAACVQRLPMASVYEWDGAIDEAEETLLLIKTTVASYDAVEAWILAHHAYQVPEILMLPAARGSAAYLEWLDQNTRPDGPVAKG
jgi:periplasmic divalent cation tolerance protein